MASFLDKQLEDKANKIKAFIEKACEERDIELDEIIVNTSFHSAEITVYLVDGSSYNLGRIGYLVKSKWPDIEVVDPEYNYEIEFKFSIS